MPETLAVGGWTMTRARFALPADTSNPSDSPLYVLPLATTAYDDGDVTLNADGTLTVVRAGLYRASASAVWQDRADGQVDLRIVGIGHLRAGQKPGVYVPGQLTKVTAKFDRLVQYDVTATNTTRTSRWQGAWKPGAIAKGQVASVDVTLAKRGVVGIGDLAFASLASIDDASVGAAAATALIVSAKVVAPDVVRVSICNPTIAPRVVVPKGELEVVAMTAVATTGSSGAARMLASSSLESLKAGDCVYGYFRSKVAGDRLRATPSTFLQLERWFTG